MQKITKSGKAGTEIVVFDQIDSTRPGGLHIDKTNAEGVFGSGGVIPAGTAVILKSGDNGVGKVLTDWGDNWGSTDNSEDIGDFADIIGLVKKDTLIEDYTLVSVVQAGTCRIEALPNGGTNADREKTNVEHLIEFLPRITFYEKV